MHGCRFLHNECTLSVRVSSCTGGEDMNVNEYAQIEMVGCEVQGRLWAQGVCVCVCLCACVRCACVCVCVYV